MKIESSVHQKRIKNIYDEYKNTVFPLVAFLEANDAEFPIEILNEVRSIFSHFSRVYDDSVTDDEIDCELSKAESHLKRAILDFTYPCCCWNNSFCCVTSKFNFPFSQNR